MKKYYLAHSCELIDSVRKWELKVQGRFKVDLINPFKGNEFENMEELRQLTTRTKLLQYMRTLDEDTCQKIVEYDLELLRKCDGLIAVFRNPSLGTAMEIFSAAYLYRIPCYIICRKYIYHPWIVHLAKRSGGEVFSSRTAFEKYLEKQGFQRY